MATEVGKFRKRIYTLTIPAGQTSVAATGGFGGVKYGKVQQFRAVLTSGSDSSTSLEIKDRRGLVLFTAGTLNFTSAINRVFTQDDTAVTGGFTATDATGAALTAGSPVAPIAEGPITITWSAGTAGETLRVELYAEV